MALQLNRVRFRASKHGVSGYSVPLPGGSRIIVENREERTDPLHYPLFKSFLRGSFEGSINAHKRKLVESENILRITKRVALDVAENGTGRPIDSEGQRQHGWRGSMKFADKARAGSAHEKRV